MGDYWNTNNDYERRREGFFNDLAKRESDDAYDRSKALESFNAERAAERWGKIHGLQGSGPISSESSIDSRSYPSRNVRRYIEHPRWLRITLFLAIFVIEILSLHVTTVNGYGWNSGGGVIILGLLSWLATSLILKLVPFFRFRKK